MVNYVFVRLLIVNICIYPQKATASITGLSNDFCFPQTNLAPIVSGARGDQTLVLASFATHVELEAVEELKQRRLQLT